MVSRPLSKVLRESAAGGWRILHFRCPGCGVNHEVWVARPPEHPGPTWGWDGNVDAPTFTPSVLVRTVSPILLREWEQGGPEIPEGSPEWVCHFFVQAGQINYLDDCSHAMRGLVPMEEFRHPEDLPPLPAPGRMFTPENRGPRRWRAV